MAFLIDDLVVWIGKKVRDMAEEELYGTEEKIQEQLLNFQAKLDMGEIKEEEYKIKEDDLLDKLEELRKKKEGEEEEKSEEDEES